MLSDIKNLDIMLGGSHFDREGSEDSILARRPESVSCNASEKNEETVHLNTRENSSANSSSDDFNRLSGELISRISREIDEMMISVSVQIQRAVWRCH